MESLGTSGSVRNLMDTEEKYFEKEILLIYKKFINHHIQNSLTVHCVYTPNSRPKNLFERFFFNRQSKAARFVREFGFFFLIIELSISYCSGKGKMQGEQPKLNKLTPLTRSGTQRKKKGTNTCVVCIYVYNYF